MSAPSPVDEFVRTSIESYREQGYRVLRECYLPDLDGRMPRFRADIVALKDDEVVVVEVKSKEQAKADIHLDSLAKTIERIPGARLDVIWLGSVDPVPGFDTALRHAGDARILREHHPDAAVLIGWAALEGVLAIRLEIEAISVTDSPNAKQMLADLYGNSLISWSRYVRLNGVARARNAIAHGGSQPVSDDDFSLLVASAEYIGGPGFKPFQEVVNEAQGFLARFAVLHEPGNKSERRVDSWLPGEDDPMAELARIIPRDFTSGEVEELLAKLMRGSEREDEDQSRVRTRRPAADGMDDLLRALRESVQRAGGPPPESTGFGNPNEEPRSAG